jgi:hypothetical protein
MTTRKPRTVISMSRIRRKARTISPGPWLFSRPRVAIEHFDETVAFAFVATLRRAGYSAGICPGPSDSADTPERCVLTTGERCLFVDGAEVVVSGLGVGTGERRAVLEALRRHHPHKPLVVAVPPEELHLYGELLDDLDVVIDPVEPAELLAAVEDAVRAETALPAAR